MILDRSLGAPAHEDSVVPPPGPPSRLAAAPLAITLLCLCACAERSPDDVVMEAVELAQAGRLEPFLDRFEPESRARLAAFWTVSDRYGYLGPDALRHLASLQIEEAREETSPGAINGAEGGEDGAVAVVHVFDGVKSGEILLVRVAGEWKIDLRPREKD